MSNKPTQQPDPARHTDAPPAPSQDSGVGSGDTGTFAPSVPSVPTVPPPPNPGLPRAFGRYLLLAVLGQGGMGVVYKAKQTGLDRVVALKMILAGPAANDQAIARFRREAQSASSLDHPHIVPIHDFGDDGGQHFYTMAYVEGQTLQRRVEQHGPLPFGETARIMFALAGAIGYAHGKGIIHRDLKPDNVLIDGAGQPRVLDFGLARLVESDRLTATGQVLGTPNYMSPEQARGVSKLGPATDVYSLGAVMYYLLTARCPFMADSALQTIRCVADEDPPPPRQVNPAVPADLEAICLRCMEKDPARRFDSAADLALALTRAGSRATADVPAPARPDGTAISSGRRWIGVAAGFVAVVALAGLGLYFALNKKPEPTTEASNGTPTTPATRTTPTEPEDPLLPKVLVKDFDLKAEMIGGTEKDGLVRLAPKTELKLKITSARDAYIAIWCYDDHGKVTTLFPNEDEEDNRLKAGVTRVIPADGTGTLKAAPGIRPEHIHVFALTKKWDVMQGTLEGVWNVHSTEEEKKQFLKKREVMYLSKNTALLSEAVIPYVVK